jgi:predicted nucleotidyltransferase
MNLLEKNNEGIGTLCKKHGVKRLFAFGSVLTDHFHKKSDVDLLVDFLNVDLYEYANNYFDLKNSLEKLFHRKVDLLEGNAIKNPYLKRAIDSSKMLIYGE